MRITGTPPGVGTGKTQGTAPRKGGDGFAKALEKSGGSTPASAPSGVASADAVQTVPDSLQDNEQRRARNINTQRAETLLDQLEAMRIALLSGRMTRDMLVTMQRLLASRRAQIKDDSLHAVLDDIELRARVELAKLER